MTLFRAHSLQCLLLFLKSFCLCHRQTGAFPDKSTPVNVKSNQECHQGSSVKHKPWPHIPLSQIQPERQATQGAKVLLNTGRLETIPQPRSASWTKATKAGSFLVLVFRKPSSSQSSLEASWSRCCSSFLFHSVQKAATSSSSGSEEGHLKPCKSERSLQISAEVYTQEWLGMLDMFSGWPVWSLCSYKVPPRVLGLPFCYDSSCFTPSNYYVWRQVETTHPKRRWEVEQKVLDLSHWNVLKT